MTIDRNGLENRSDPLSIGRTRSDAAPNGHGTGRRRRRVCKSRRRVRSFLSCRQDDESKRATKTNDDREAPEGPSGASVSCTCPSSRRPSSVLGLIGFSFSGDSFDWLFIASVVLANGSLFVSSLLEHRTAISGGIPAGIRHVYVCESSSSSSSLLLLLLLALFTGAPFRIPIVGHRRRRRRRRRWELAFVCVFIEPMESTANA